MSIHIPADAVNDSDDPLAESIRWVVCGHCSLLALYSRVSTRHGGATAKKNTKKQKRTLVIN